MEYELGNWLFKLGNSRIIDFLFMIKKIKFFIYYKISAYNMQFPYNIYIYCTLYVHCVCYLLTQSTCSPVMCTFYHCFAYVIYLRRVRVHLWRVHFIIASRALFTYMEYVFVCDVYVLSLLRVRYLLTRSTCSSVTCTFYHCFTCVIYLHRVRVHLWRVRFIIASRALFTYTEYVFICVMYVLSLFHMRYLLTRSMSFTYIMCISFIIYKIYMFFPCREWCSFPYMV